MSFLGRIEADCGCPLEQVETALKEAERLRDVAPSELAGALVETVMQTEGPSGVDLWLRKLCERLRETGTRLGSLADALEAEAPMQLQEPAIPDEPQTPEMFEVRVPVEGD